MSSAPLEEKKKAQAWPVGLRVRLRRCEPVFVHQGLRCDKLDPERLLSTMIRSGVERRKNAERSGRSIMPRALWKGTLGFGLVTIGVELHTADAPEELDLDLLDRRDNARIRYQKINASTGKPVPQDEIVKGFAVSKEKYVVLTDQELKAANPKSTQTVDIVGFVPRDEIDRIYYARPYYVAPQKGSDKAYALLREALRQSDQIALAQIVIRTRQYVAAVYPYEAALVVHLLRYHDELKKPSGLGIPDDKAAKKLIRPQELAMAEQLMKSMASAWKPEDFTDTYRKDVLKLIKRRAKGGAKAKAAPAPDEEAGAKVLDLMAALKRSVESRGTAATKASRAAPRARTRAKKSA
jgi:DNA end-binding protein Ku